MKQLDGTNTLWLNMKREINLCLVSKQSNTKSNSRWIFFFKKGGCCIDFINTLVLSWHRHDSSWSLRELTANQSSPCTFYFGSHQVYILLCQSKPGEYCVPWAMTCYKKKQKLAIPRSLYKRESTALLTFLLTINTQKYSLYSIKDNKVGTVTFLGYLNIVWKGQFLSQQGLPSHSLFSNQHSSCKGFTDTQNSFHIQRLSSERQRTVSNVNITEG